MRCFLMNKNKKIALIELNTEFNNIEKIYEVYDINYAPLSFKNAFYDKTSSNEKILNNWYKGRGIPDWRKDIKNLLENLNIKSTDELLNKSYALSLSDQYWIKEETQDNLKWKDINFFTNDFKYKGYLQISLSSSNIEDEIDLKSPNNTTDGMLQKAWIIENNKRILVKGTFYSPNQEPLNEWLVSQICEKLNLDFCNYEISIIDNKIVSKCEDFINENQEIITADDIFYSEKKDNNTNDFEHYVSILEKNGIEDARKKVQDMFLIDYIVMNFDRHMKNFGIIRNVETLKWEKVTPIFDTGESMQCNKLLSEMNFYDGKCKFFTNINKDISDLLKYIELDNYNFDNLIDIPKMFRQELEKYKQFTDMTDERIEKLYIGLSDRIFNLINYQKKIFTLQENDEKEKDNTEDDEEEM